MGKEQRGKGVKKRHKEGGWFFSFVVALIGAGIGYNSMTSYDAVKYNIAPHLLLLPVVMAFYALMGFIAGRILFTIYCKAKNDK